MVKCSKNLEVEVVDGVLNGESLGSYDRATENHSTWEIAVQSALDS